MCSRVCVLLDRYSKFVYAMITAAIVARKCNSRVVNRNSSRTKSVVTAAGLLLIVASLTVVLLVVFQQQQNDTSPSHSDIFSAKYARDDWRGGSGPGSFVENTVPYRQLLQRIFDDDRFQSFVDLGCGDFQIMKLINVPAGKTYRGIDVVRHVIEQNERLYGGRPNYQFSLIDDLRDLKLGSRLLQGVDMLIVKDVLIHLSNSDIQYFVDQILPNAKFALITNDYTDDGDYRNDNIPTGTFRPVDLTYPPFNLKGMQLVLRYSYDSGNTIKRVYLYTNPAFII